MNQSTDKLSIWLLTMAFVIVSSFSSTTGPSGHTTYYQGNGPIIFLSQHGGATTANDLSISPRHNGCYNSATETCDWTKGCNSGRTESQLADDAIKCKAKIVKDSYTRELADCLRTTTSLQNNGATYTNHLIINELHREVLDANREKNEAAMGYSVAETAWDEIHSASGFVKQAKDIAKSTSQCGFGIIIDIHGQKSNDFNHLGYRAQKHQLEYTDYKLTTWNYYRKRSSIWDMVSNNEDLSATPDFGYADIIRGDDGLGTYLENKLTQNNGGSSNYKVIPSKTNPKMVPYSNTYYTGGFAAKYHGSSDVNELDSNGNPSIKSSVTVDVIQLEVNSDIRKNENSASRAQFCTDFSEAIVTWVNKWYPVSQCTTSPAPALKNDKISDDGIHHYSGDKNVTKWSEYSAVIIIIVSLLMVSVCLIFGLCVLFKKRYSNKINPQPIDDKDAYDDIVVESNKIEMMENDSTNK